MRRGSLTWRTVGACAVVGVAAVTVLALLGQPLTGLALAVGLMIGSVNGLMIGRALRSEMGFRASSMGRLTVLTVAGLGVTFLFGLPTGLWVLAGLAGAQLVLAGLAAAEAARA